MHKSPTKRHRRLPPAQAIAALAVCAGLLIWTAAAEACPMCKAALGTGAEAHINAWGISIVFMLSMPFLLVGSFSLYMYVLVRRARAQEAARHESSSRDCPPRHAATPN